MFEFKGIHASVYGTVTINPILSKPSQKTSINTIEGSDKAFRTALGFNTYTIPTQITLFENTDIDDVKTWLNGEGELVLDELDDRYIVAYVDEQFTFERFSRGIKNKVIDVTFLVTDPFFYEHTALPTVLTASGNVTNLGNVNSQPILQIVGSGVVTITIGGRSFSYNFDTANVVIDSEEQDAYFGSIANLKNRRMTGEFPYLTPGVNAVSWTGTVTSITFTKVSKWL